MSRIALLGLGKMGQAMVVELVLAGHEVKVWNRTKESAQELAQRIDNNSLLSLEDTVGGAISDVDFVITMLLSGEVTEQVLLENLADSDIRSSVNPRTIFIDMGTSGVKTAQLLEAAICEYGFRFIDAPVSGSIATIVAHQLLVLASGKEDAIAQATPMLLTFSKKVANLGEAGSGQAMKLAVNLIVHSLDAAVSEGLGLAIKSGIDPNRAYDVLEESVVAAPFVKYKRAAFLDPGAPVAMRIDTVLKDLTLIGDFALDLGLRLEALPGVTRAFQAASDRGLAARDMARLIEIYP